MRNIHKKILDYFFHLDKEKSFQFLLLSLFIAGIILRIFYLSYTTYDQRSYDWWGHLGYINYLADHNSLPSQNQCWQCYQPPFYYLLGSSVVGLCRFFNFSTANSIYALQILSLFFFSVFLIFSLSILNKFLNHNKVLLLLAWALLIFWPSGVIHSVRIGNDVLLYLLSTASLWFLILWNENNDRRDLLLAFLLAVLSVYTKSNGLVVLFLAVFILFFKTFFEKNKLSFLKNKAFLIVFIFVALLPSANNLINFEGWENKNSFWLVSNSHQLGNDMLVGRKIENFLTFDFPTLLESPFLDVQHDKEGRQFFLIALFKTSLWGQFSSNKEFIKSLALSTSFAFFILIIYIFLGSLWLKDSFWKKYFVPVSFGLALFGASFFMRLLIPFSCTNDFRFIFPIIIPFIIILFSVINELEKRNLFFFAYLGCYLTILIPILSIIIFTIKFE